MQAGMAREARAVGRLVRFAELDPRLGSEERSSQRSDELLSVPDRSIRHLMLNARRARGL